MVSGCEDPVEVGWRRRAELGSLLLQCRSRLTRADAEGRDRGLRQRDVAELVGISVRYYAALERGEASPSGALVEAVAAALHMERAQRSALHVLALGHDPVLPMPEASQSHDRPPVPAVLRQLVRHLDPTPAAIVDEMWTVLAANTALSRCIGCYADQVPPDEQNLILWLFSPEAEQVLTDIRRERRAAIAGLRYAYVRHIASPRFAMLISRLLATGPEAREIWERHEIEIPRRTTSHRIRRADGRTAEVDVVHSALSHRLSLLIAMPRDDTGQNDP
ncbi:MAG TPA: helix-turn-helix domain-containing protein [Streptosporangiaceae bacterium]|jgi:transcriptional regulator with XRE-family HTH domain